MCRAEVDPAAESLLAALLRDIGDALADASGTERDAVVIGPVDFGLAVRRV